MALLMTAPPAFVRWLARWRLLPLLLSAGLLAGCGTAGYYAQAIGGQLALMQAARPIDDWLRDPATPAPLKARLALAQQLRDYAVTALDLPDNDSYRRYADIHRRAVVWNVAAAPVDSLTLKRWCFAFVGCVGYRGYFDPAEAQVLGQQLRRDEGLEVTVYGVPMYSTLGWLNWLGGDPLLSTVIHDSDAALARIVFHELAHQKLYVAGDTAFNESYATAVASLGAARWLARHADAAARRADELAQQRQRDFRQLTHATRAELSAIYEQKSDPARTEQALLAMKSEAMQRFRARYQALKARWAAAGTPFDGYDRWVAQANNAAFALQAAYDGWVPAFEALFAREGGDWPRFYAAVRALGELPRDERDARLRALAPAAARPPV